MKFVVIFILIVGGLVFCMMNRNAPPAILPTVDPPTQPVPSRGYKASRGYKVERRPSRDITIVFLTWDESPTPSVLEKSLRAEAEAEAKSNPDMCILATGLIASDDDHGLKLSDGSRHVTYDPKMKKVMTMNEWEAVRKSQGKSLTDP